MNRQERVAYNARKGKLTAYGIITLGIICILCSSFLYYYQGYKNKSWVTYTGVALGYVGGIILFIAVNIKYLAAKKLSFKKDRIAWVKQQAIKWSVFAISILIAVEYMIGLGKLSDRRINHILNTEPTNITIASVVDIQQHQSRGGSYHVAVIKYQANGIYYQNEIGENIGEYQIGDKLKIKYSVEYPEMFYTYRQ